MWGYGGGSISKQGAGGVCKAEGGSSKWRGCRRGRGKLCSNAHFFLIGKNVNGVISQEKCDWSRKFKVQQTGSLDPLSPPPLKRPTSPYTNELLACEQALLELLGV